MRGVAVVAATRALALDPPIDFDHQTQEGGAPGNGEPCQAPTLTTAAAPLKNRCRLQRMPRTLLRSGVALPLLP